MIYPYNVNNRKDSTTIEYLNFDGPFYCGKGLEIQDVALCCSSCNSSRGAMKLTVWFRTN